ncbi:DUF721 domain-containing protein [Desulfosarcina sp. OttesenSCG-928-A07]|nr:DUF721 domain-containing protein [Desulfosarcina sp. OttesenSCG-928-G17]MDL2328712.1 DUF721 domain-containing protein [Desulfosarcina sp. OttesenSCG-928-A07]
MGKTAPSGPSFTPIGTVLDTLLKQCGARTRGGIPHLSQVWEKTVGSPISENAKPFAIQGSVLVVHVSSSPWLHHLQFLKSDLIKTLNHHLSASPLTDIRFKVGRW